MNEWQVLCLRLNDGMVAPLAKTKRELSKKDQRRLCRKFRHDGDYAGEVVMTVDRAGLTEQEFQMLPRV